MYFSPLLMITALATSLAAAAPTSANELELSAALGTGNTLAVRDNPTIKVTLHAAPDFKTTAKRSIKTQTECQSIANLQDNGYEFRVDIPSGYYCRFWRTDKCNGRSTSDMHSGTVYLSVDSFKCYKDKK
ncbi:hypothetical protein BDW74DRAFT_175660 [Aspergillus multicolor]|uniref:uncharacterized protein n=1 Tax=Aspergillus multicolor TaxID=41759 RepID=UPI003CCE1AB8